MLTADLIDDWQCRKGNVHGSAPRKRRNVRMRYTIHPLEILPIPSLSELNNLCGATGQASFSDMGLVIHSATLSNVGRSPSPPHPHHSCG